MSETMCHTVTDRLIEAALAMLRGERPVPPRLEAVAEAAGVAPDLARTIFPDETALVEAAGSFGIMRMIDHISQRLIAAPADDPRSALIALGLAYVEWARDNPGLYRVIGHRVLQPELLWPIYERYDEGFRALIERHLGETRETAGFRALVARSFVFGLVDMMVDQHLTIWRPAGMTDDQAMRGSIEYMVDLILAAPRAADQPIRSDA